MLGVLLLFVAGRCLVPMDETDLFFNLRLGETVLATGQVPTDNFLSFTHPDARDVNLAWVFQIVLALTHRVAGIAGTVVLKTAFAVGTWALLYRVAVRRGAHPAAAALALALAAWAAEPRFVERPHLVTFLGLAFLLLAIERAEAGKPRALWALVPAGLVWANANSCFFLAPVALLLYAAGAFADGQRAHAGRALLVAAALVPLIFATPSGWWCLRYLANHFRMPSLRPLEEYRVATWPLDGPFFFLVAGVLAGAVTRRIPLRCLAPLVALGVLGSRRIRFVAEFAMLAGPAVAVTLTSLARRTRWTVPAAAGLLLVLTVLPRARAVAAGGRWLDLSLEKDLVPLSAIAFTDRHGLRGRMYNDLEVGSYLTWEGWPRHRVFQDPRINGYPDDFHAVLRRADLTRPEWQSLMDRFSVDAALITYPDVNPRAALFAPASWALVYRAHDGLVFTRRTPARAAFIAAHELPLSFTRAADGAVSPVPLEAQPGPPVAPCPWQRRLGDFHAGTADDARARAAYQRALDTPGCDEPESAAVRSALGAAALRLGDPAAALEALEGLTDPLARTNRGYALLGLRRPDQALAELEAVLASAPSHDEATFGRALALEALGRGAEAAAAYRALLARSPDHLAAPQARERLRRLAR